jgi:rRNA maturation endonuclease Nob1
MAFITKCKKCGKVYSPKKPGAPGPTEEGFCPDCFQVILRDRYSQRTLEEQLRNPYINSIYREYFQETGTYLTLYNLEVLAKINKLEMAGNYDQAYNMLASNNNYFSKRNSLTIANEGRRLVLGQNEKQDRLVEEQKKRAQDNIDKLILCGRYEEAAVAYERLGMWKEAGDTRRMERTVKNVNVDLNKLLEEIRYGGLGLQYKCPNCGSSTAFKESDVGAIKNCAYCGAQIDTDSMMKIIREAIR